MKTLDSFAWLLSSLLLTGTFTLDAAGASRGWRDFYAVEGAEGDQKLDQDARGNIHVGGTVWQGDAGWGVSIVKYSPDGHRLWASVFDSNSPGESRGIDNHRGFALDTQENVYVAVARFAPSASVVVFKLDSSGNLLWQQRGEGFPAEIGVDAAGNCFVAGTIEWNGVEGNGPQSFLMKLSPDGRKLWERRYVSTIPPYWGNATSLAVDPTGNAFVVGFQFTISKFDGDGNELWRRDYSGQSATKVISDGFGNAYVTGTRLEGDALTVKLDPTGRELWKSVYLQPGAQWNSPSDLTFDSRGNVYFTVISDLWKPELVKLDADGNVAWHQTERKVGDLARHRSVAVDGHGRTWLLFTTPVDVVSADAVSDVVLSSFDARGKRLSTTRLRSRRNDTAYAADILLDRQGNPVVTFLGRPEVVSGWVTTKLSQARNFKPIWPPLQPSPKTTRN